MDPQTRRELPVVERTAARLVVLDAAGRILLLHAGSEQPAIRHPVPG
jgi:hypothetical protein